MFGGTALPGTCLGTTWYFAQSSEKLPPPPRTLVGAILGAQADEHTHHAVLDNYMLSVLGQVS